MYNNDFQNILKISTKTCPAASITHDLIPRHLLGFQAPRLSIRRHQAMGSDPALHLDHASSAKGSKTTWHH